MNRRDRRRAAEAFARGFRCPDCASDTALEEAAPGVYVLEVHHDETCPAYTAITGRTTR